VPAGFEKNNTSGFVPVYGRLEYGLTSHISLGVAFVYEVFQVNFYKLYEANGKTFRRSNTDQVNLFSGNLFGAWHFGDLLHVRRLDPFVTLGLGLNTLSYTHKPQGDSTVSTTEHTVSPFIRAGARYNLSKRGSLFADLGYDDKAVLTVGFSCRLNRKVE
jgi:hypothetical protein